MKITILLMAIIALTSTAQAGYRIVIPMEQSKGGPLPNGSISITPKTPSLPVENWQPAEPLYGEWINVGGIYGCSNWGPDPSTQTIGVTFDQTATDCKQDQTTTKQEREQETTTLVYRNIGEPSIESKSVAVHSTRKVTGTKENWQPAEPLYSEWVDFGNVYGCSNWTPDASTMLKDETFNQTAKDCIQYQTRTRQNREQETTTLAYRNVGERVTMGQNVTASSSRTATGTAACSYSFYVNGTPSTFWMAGTNTSTNAYIVYLNDVQIRSENGYDTTSITLNGKTYKRGTTVKVSTTNQYGTYRYYEVCK